MKGLVMKSGMSDFECLGCSFDMNSGWIEKLRLMERKKMLKLDDTLIIHRFESNYFL